MPLIDVALIATSLFGHLSLCVGAINRLHASAISRPVLHLFERTVFLLAGGLPLLAAYLWPNATMSSPVVRGLFAAQPMTGVYFWLCFAVGIFTFVRWTYRRLRGSPRQLIGVQRSLVRAAEVLGHKPCGDRATMLLAGIPGNQVLELEVSRKRLLLPRLARVADGLKIAHVSDLHFTGHLTQAYFEFVVDQVNQLHADLVTITGDIVDAAECLPWISETLGRLRAPGGVYCVLGNHDLRIGDKSKILDELTRAGIVYLGGTAKTVKFRENELLLAGNELPWWQPAPDIAAPLPQKEKLRILLAHTPDQIAWAARHDFDLMLAGHTHGGQICFPVIGPILAHSRYGVKYASGVFYRSPTVLHVSRGVSGVENVRFHCRPEITELVLCSGLTAPDQAAQPNGPIDERGVSYAS